MTGESKQIVLARRWAEALGNTIESVTGVDAEGKPVTAIGVRHGPVPLVVAESPTGVLAVMTMMDIPADLRTAINGLPGLLQSKMYDTLKLAFMDGPRAGFALLPLTATRIGLVERIPLTELVRIEESDVGSFNRFGDAIPELVTLMVRGQQVYSAVFVGGPSMESKSRPTRDVGIYR